MVKLNGPHQGFRKLPVPGHLPADLGVICPQDFEFRLYVGQLFLIDQLPDLAQSVRIQMPTQDQFPDIMNQRCGESRA